MLLVEDEVLLSEITKRFFTRAGYEVTSCGDGIEALAAFNEKQFDFVFTDSIMPNMDGPTLCKEIRNLDKNVIIYLTSGYDKESSLKKAEKYIDGFLEKPYEPNKAVEIIDLELEKIAHKKNKIKILVMDDAEQITEPLTKILRDYAYEVSIVKDGDSALDAYKQCLGTRNSYDLVILDLDVPGRMDGKETMVELVKMDQNIIGVLFSGYYGPEDKKNVNYQKQGFKSFLPKPCSMDYLNKMMVKLFPDKFSKR